MKIVIGDERKISAIQKEFNALFPYLKIEFFSIPHKAGEGSAKKIIKSPLQTIGECRSVNSRGTLVITPGITVTELEQNFKEMFGLSAQVFRKSGKAWLETTVTDSWTLEKQNQQGKMLSDFLSERENLSRNEAAE